MFRAAQAQHQTGLNRPVLRYTPTVMHEAAQEVIMVQGRTDKDNFTTRTQTIGRSALSSHLTPCTARKLSLPTDTDTSLAWQPASQIAVTNDRQNITHNNATARQDCGVVV